MTEVWLNEMDSPATENGCIEGGLREVAADIEPVFLVASIAELLEHRAGAHRYETLCNFSVTVAWYLHRLFLSCAVTDRLR